MYVYKITNKIDSKCYVGQTIKDPKIRFNEHCSLSSGCWAIRDAIIKHGRDNFRLEILAEATDSDHLNELEVKYIKKYDCVHPKGYNLTNGRSGVAKLILSVTLPTPRQLEREQNNIKRRIFAGPSKLYLEDCQELWTDRYLAYSQSENICLTEYEMKAIDLITGLYKDLKLKKITKTNFKIKSGYILQEINSTLEKLAEKQRRAKKFTKVEPELCPRKIRTLGIICALYDEGYPLSIINTLLSRSYLVLLGNHKKWSQGTILEVLAKYYTSKDLILDLQTDYYQVFKDYLASRRLKFKVCRP